MASDRVSLAWAQLEAPAAVSVPLIVATELADGAAVVKLVNNRLERMCRFLAATLEFGAGPHLVLAADTTLASVMELMSRSTRSRNRFQRLSSALDLRRCDHAIGRRGSRRDWSEALRL